MDVDTAEEETVQKSRSGTDQSISAHPLGRVVGRFCHFTAQAPYEHLYIPWTYMVWVAVAWLTQALLTRDFATAQQALILATAAGDRDLATQITTQFPLVAQKEPVHALS